MLLPAVCPACKHEFQVDSGYIGIKRKCPACGEAFVFEVEDADSGRILGAADFGQGERIGCPQCFRVGVVKPVYAGRQVVPCSICGTDVDRVIGARFLEVLKASEETANRLLLAGQVHADVPAALIACGMPEGRVEDFMEQQLTRLPFLRYQATKTQDLDGKYEVAPAPNCDLCSALLRGQGADAVYYVHWRKVQRGSSRDADVAVAGLMFGVAGAMLASATKGDDAVDGSAASEHHAVYCLCPRCLDSLKAWFFNKYTGFPASEGFKVHKLTRTTL